MILIPPTDPILWTPAAPVTDTRAQVKPHLPAMRRLLARHKGWGLSAPQVGISFQFFITRIEGVHVAINPQILALSDKRDSVSEGCLSFDEGKRFVSVERSKEVDFEWTDLKGNVHFKTFTGVEARILLHEYHHLQGVCIFPRPESP